MILVSGCLSGANCFYNGISKASEPIKKLVEEKKAVPVCPELLGGLPPLREPSEIKGGTGKDVLAEKCRVITKSGKDVTLNFIAGAQRVLLLAKKYNAEKAVLKSCSPACGCGQIYDGSFTGKLVEGDGVTCALLKINEIQVVSDDVFMNSL